MSKTQETLKLESQIREATNKVGTFGCFEVTIGFGGKERVDYMTYDTKGIFRCYEIKVSRSDFYSKNKNSFVGHYNYYVLTAKLYHQVRNDIPDYVGVYVGDSCVKRPKKQDIDSIVHVERRTVNGKSTEVFISRIDLLKDSFIRSLARDSQKLHLSNNKGYVEHMNRQLDRVSSDKTKFMNKFYLLYDNISLLLGTKMADLLSNEDNTLMSMFYEKPENRRIQASNCKQLSQILFECQGGAIKYSVNDIEKMLNPIKEGEINGQS